MTIWDGKLVNVGSFNSPCGKVATWDETTWGCLGGGVGLVGRAATEWDGKLVVVGDFWNVFLPCTDCHGIAVWDGVSWSNLGTGFNNDVLVVYNWDGVLVAAGDFTEADDVPCNRIAWWDGSGWQSFGVGVGNFDNDIRCIAEFEDELWIGGDFANVDGCTSCDRLVKWTGTTWVGGDSGVDITGGVDNTVRVLYVNPNDGNLYMGGHFTDLSIDDVLTPFNGVAMYDGSEWTPLGSGVNNYVRAIHEYNGNLIVGGDFNNASGVPASKVAKWNPTTSTWSAMGTGMNDYIKSAAVYNGVFYAGGAFTTADGLSREYIASWYEDAGPLVTEIGDEDNENCFGECDGAATITITGGNAPYDILWDDPAAQTTATAEDLCPGTYTVTVTDSDGDVSTETITIGAADFFEAEADVTSSFSGADVSCFGNSDGEATADPDGGDSPYTYQWDAAAGSQTTVVATGLSAGTYTVEITDDEGCVATADVTITDPAEVVASISDSEDVLCFGESTGFADGIGSGGVGGFSYSWNTIPEQTTPTATGLTDGNYCLTVQDANGCTDVVCITINEPAELLTSVTSTTDFGGYDISCFGEEDGAANAGVTGGTTPYTWLWDDGQITEDATDLAAGTYNVEITDANGCITTGTITLTEPTEITASGSSTESTCDVADGTATIVISGGTGVYTYEWDAAAGSQTTATATSLFAGTYSVEITDENGCTLIEFVTVSDAGAPDLLITSDNALCAGDCNGTATVSASGGAGSYVYFWDVAPWETTTADSLCPGTYFITVTDGDGCEAIESVTIDSPTPISVSISSSPADIVCDGTAGVVPSGGTFPYTYLWDAAAGSQTTATATDLCPGTYCVTVTDDNDCKLDTCLTVGGSASLDENSDGIFVIYPNPAGDGYLNISSSLSELVSVKLYSSTGQLILTSQISKGNNVLNVPVLSPGLYSIHLEGKDVYKVEKIVII